MPSEKILHVNPGHLSGATQAVLELRDRGPQGSAFFRRGDKMLPMMRAQTFTLEIFGRVYEKDHLRIEEAMPLDLLFLHQVALQNGYEELSVDPAADRDKRLPWYGEGNRIEDIGDLLRTDEPRLAHRKTRHLDAAGQIEAIGPTQIRTGKISLRMEEPDLAGPGM